MRGLGLFGLSGQTIGGGQVFLDGECYSSCRCLSQQDNEIGFRLLVSTEECCVALPSERWMVSHGLDLKTSVLISSQRF